MANFTPRMPARATVFRTISIAVIVIGVTLVALAAYVYFEAIRTFEVRRVSLPTRIYADMFPLRPGTPIQKDDLLEKLERLGYRSAGTLTQPGEFNIDGAQVNLYLRGFRHPTGEYPPRRMQLTLRKSVIDSVAALDGVAGDAALEPELLTSILSDQLENRRPITLDQVPKHLLDAVVVTEDVRFWNHPGVDPIGIFRAIFRNVRARGVAEGGSTLTQQLVKNYYLTNERTLRRKVVEAFMSVILDAKYSKEEILEAYLNDIYLGRNRSISILGVGEAARFYFGKPVAEITIGESAIIAGMIRSPNNNSPFANADRALTRRRTVLDLMLRNEKITRAQHDASLKEKLPNKPFRARGSLSSIPFYVDTVIRELQRDYGMKEIRGQGLQIYTAINLEAQNSATTALQTGLANLEKRSRRLRRSSNPLEGVAMVVDVPTGEIRALVGGRNYERSQFNRAMLAKRQVGSLFKPIAFMAAFEPSLSRQNVSPATLVNDSRFVLERKYSKDWSPRNYGEQYYGTVTVRRALELSMNAASVRVGLVAGVPAIIKTAHVLGVKEELEDVPSLILGSVGVPPFQMAEAYTTIARLGSKVPLRTVRYVTDDRGRVLTNADEIKAVQVFPARATYLVVRLMQGVMDRGTAAGARSLGFRKTAAGKTGTTNEKRDAWFIGFTPKTLGLTWIGFDDNKPTGLSGSDGAVPVWTRMMREVTAGEPDREFPVPQGISFVPVDTLSGGVATPFCPSNAVVTEAFKDGTEPQAPCRLHQPQLAPQPYDPSMDPSMTTTDPAMVPPGYTPPPIDTQSPPPPPDSGEDEPELGGGFGRTDTAAPPPPPTTTIPE